MKQPYILSEFKMQLRHYVQNIKDGDYQILSNFRNTG